MPPVPVARQGDKTSHGGTIGPPVGPAAARLPTVLVEGRPVAAVGGVHACVKPPDPLLGPGNLVIPDPPVPPRTVLVAGLPVALIGDRTTCGAKIVPRLGTVQVGGLL
ncbi:PAAR domain-containing protein [Saccharothrix sp. BKS2]|uniref:PAAR domain-containing protein n=1 Tax=Saccharothrix sp. BKS2 TaxID=3064400 RepID=UPI0039EC92A7